MVSRTSTPRSFMSHAVYVSRPKEVCSADRRSRIARSVEDLAMSSIK